MAAIDDLKAAWVKEIAKISDALIKAEADYALDQYVAALPRQAALEANEIASYSIGGRSFTRRDITAGQIAIERLRNNLYRYCKGSTSLVDANMNYTPSEN